MLSAYDFHVFLNSLGHLQGWCSCVKLFDAKQAKQVYQYKNAKLNLCKNNAAIWANKTRNAKQLIPTYANVKIKGDNLRFQKTKNAAIRYRINQELKFQ